MRSMALVVVVSLCALMLGGCLLPKAPCRLSIANATTQTVSRVSVTDENGSVYRFAELGPHAISPPQAVGQPLGPAVLVGIAMAGAEPVEQTVTFKRAVPPDFRGRVVFQVGTNATIRSFVLPDRGGVAAGDIPWTRPEPWQGVPGIPGFTAEE